MGKDISIDKSILKEWSTAVFNNCFNGNSALLETFKSCHLEEYKVITAMYRKRVVLNDCIAVMEDMKEPIYWFTLTFNNDKDCNAVLSKRKEAERFLNMISICYVMVEEFGEDNGRYHVHGFLCFKYGYGFLDFTSWHSRQKIELLDGSKVKKKVRYLTKYAVKSVPRIRKSKTMCLLYNYFKTHKRFRKLFYDTYKQSFNTVVASVVNPF